MKLIWIITLIYLNKLRRPSTKLRKSCLNALRSTPDCASRVCLCIFLKVSLCEAGVLKDMQNFFSKFGALTNSSSGSAFQDQSAGYMTGGSLFVRNPVHTQRILAATAPNYRAGCGGIDIWSGGFSYINAEGLKKSHASHCF